MKGVKGIIDSGQGVIVNLGLVVELVVFSTKLVSTILFLHNNNGAGVWARTGPNNTMVKHLIHFRLDDLTGDRGGTSGGMRS